MNTNRKLDGSTLDAIRALVLARGQHLMGHVAVGLGIGELEDAVDSACQTGEDVGCLVAALIDGLENADGLLDAVTEAVRDYFDVGVVA